MALLRDKETKVIREVNERYVRRWPNDYDAPTKKQLEEFGVKDVDAAYKESRELVAAYKTTTVESEKSAGGTEGADS